MTKTIAAVILTIASPALAVGILIGQATSQPSTAELDQSAHDLCQELGGQWHTKSDAWCQIHF